MALSAAIFMRKYSYKVGVLSGLAFLETAANLYILAMGAEKTAT